MSKPYAAIHPSMLHSATIRAGLLAGLMLAAGPAAYAQATAAETYRASAGPVGSMELARWLDFAGLDVAKAQGASGQDFAFAVTSDAGVQATLALNLWRPGILYPFPPGPGNLLASALPVKPVAAPYPDPQSHRGSALGAVLYKPDTAARRPALVSSTGSMLLNLRQIVLRNSAGHALQFKLVAADAEETVPVPPGDYSEPRSETLSFQTDGGSWDGTEAVQITPVRGDKPATVLRSPAFGNLGDTITLSSRLTAQNDPAAPLDAADYRASAWLHPTLNPTAIRTQFFNTSTSNQAAAFAVIPLIPEASVACAATELLPGQSATCTVSVVHPPQSAYSLPLVLSGDGARFGGCASVDFAALQTSATCTLTPTSGPAAAVDVSVGVDAAQPGWLVTGQAVRVSVAAQDDGTGAPGTGGPGSGNPGNGTPGASVQAVPANAAWALALLAAALGALGWRRAGRAD
ncbi:hypothetical protein [Diaphorobacter caeni]|uniref:hypothetical protein n=1 Tax=Diaphorobacter caeni TaxID=2784387 RepID=UPI00188F76A0|nr:hypothetical protein [Diaphorobacter caeni]MBF5006042.1 hypothetical protein [Diaphorobacter caeni]